MTPHERAQKAIDEIFDESEIAGRVIHKDTARTIIERAILAAVADGFASPMYAFTATQTIDGVIYTSGTPVLITDPWIA